MIPVLDYGYVKLVGHLGSDQSIIEAARMSTDKGFQGWDKDSRLLAYLWKNKHTSPFEMCEVVIEAYLPLFVANQWVRHRTQSYNFLSGRYVEMPEDTYQPLIEIVQMRDDANKQAAGKGEMSWENAVEAQQIFRENAVRARVNYLRLIELGVAFERARTVLPLGTYTRVRAKANLLNWLKFLKLRSASDAQWEMQKYSNAVGSIVAKLYPKTWELFSGESV